jgi:hypothetical protein
MFERDLFSENRYPLFGIMLSADLYGTAGNFYIWRRDREKQRHSGAAPRGTRHDD